MKKIFDTFAFVMLLTLVLTACGPKATAAPANKAATEAPIPKNVPVTGSDSTPISAPIDLAGPKMEVGSSFLYVDGTTIVAVPGSEFTMGRKGGTDNPEHKVTLADFWIYSTEVTNEQFKVCVASGKCTEPDLTDNQAYNDSNRVGEPVSGVNWDQAAAYCKFVHARLPTEAEWEKAARGPDANIYPWGDAAPACDLLNFNNCVVKPTRVSRYPEGKSYYGLFDMAGNVYEWVADWYDPFFYKNSPAENPIGPEIAQKRSVRSSAYDSSAEQSPAFVRYFNFPRNHSRDLGFRCVVEDPQYFAPFCKLSPVNGLAPNGQAISGGDSSLNCPSGTLNQPIPGCNNGVPFTNVEIPPELLPYTDLGACQPDPSPNHPNIYTCSGTTTVTVNVGPGCQSSQSGQAGCPAGYSQNGNSCEPSQTWAGACLEGSTFDTANQCCTVPGQGSSSNLPGGCPAGYSPNATTNACDQLPPSNSYYITPNGCNPGNPGNHEGGGPGGVPVNPQNPGNPGNPTNPKGPG